MLKMTKIKLEPIPDPDMCIFCEKDTRCEISYISNRYSKANKKKLKYYDLKQEWNDILYTDANNSNGYAMYKFLPKSGLKWIDPEEFDLN